jgi:serine/threonine protein kinase
MNSLGFMHRDIKLENILLRTKDEKNIEPVYIDFGLSTALLSS